MNRELIGRIDARRSNEILAVDAYDGELLTLLADCKAALSQAEPVASVPQDVEEFIESSTRKMKDVDGFIIDAVYTDDLRAWMAGHARVQNRVIVNLVDALRDARSGMRCIRQTHGDLYGIGFDRVEKRSTEALRDLESCMLTASKERNGSASQQEGGK